MSDDTPYRLLRRLQLQDGLGAVVRTWEGEREPTTAELYPDVAEVARRHLDGFTGYLVGRYRGDAR